MELQDKFTTKRTYQLLVYWVVAAEFAIFWSRMGTSTQSSSASIISGEQ